MPGPRRSARGGVTYRKTTLADLGLLVDHRHRMWSDIAHHSESEISDHDPRYRVWARSRLKSGELVGIVARTTDGEPVASGCVWYRPDQPRPRLPSLVSPYILSMFTEPAWRGRGVATRIVKELLREIRRAGYPNVELHASRFGRHVYGRLGFDRTWEMRLWLDRRSAPKKKVPAPSREKKRKRLDRVR